MQSGANRLAVIVMLAACLALVAGCATSQAAKEANDPLQPMNRAFFAFNDGLDRHVVEPVSKVYVKVTPEKVRSSVTNFFENVGYVNVVLNQFLQGKVHQGIRDTLRFVFNSTIGVGGLFDVASSMDLPRHEEDFGQTLAVWGVGEGPYLVLPVFGPSSFRDAPGLAVGAVTSGLFYVDNLAITIPLRVLEGVNTRTNLATAIKLQREALDPYVFTREAYRQRRRFLIYDGNPPLEEFNFEEEGEPLPEAKPPAENPTPEQKPIEEKTQ
jgi:phospholipid-binding lipoprotein MlaA